MAGPEQDHWLVRPATIRLLWVVFIAILAGLVALDLVVTHHPHFDAREHVRVRRLVRLPVLRRARRLRQGARSAPEAAGYLL